MGSISSSSFPQVYEDLGIATNKLGCIMLDVEPLIVSDVINENDLYYATDAEAHSYVDGIVCEETPHVTLLFGLMRSGHEMKKHVDAVLGFESPIDLPEYFPTSVKIDHVDFFESNYADEAYYCIIAKLEVTDALLEANGRLRMLPHIDTFMTYTPHITLAYIKHNDTMRDSYVEMLNTRLAGKSVKAVGINYGD